MKTKLFTLLLLFSCLLASAQNDSINYLEIIKSLEEKVALLSDLQSKFDDLSEQNRKINKSKYDELYFNVKKGVELQDEISNIYDKIDKQIRKNKVDNTLNRVNNPTSEVLGFKFSDVILNSAKTIFDKKEFKKIPESKKNKFISIVDKIINNPIVSTVASSFPITGTIRSVITAASTFFTEPNVSLDVEKKKGKVSGVTAKVIPDNGFSNEFIEQYVKAIMPYLNFYETIENANLDYDFAISDLKRRNKNLGDLIQNTDVSISEALSLPNGTSLTGKLTRVESAFKFSESSGKDFNYVEIIERTDIKNANNVSKQIGLLALDLSNFYSEFLQIQIAKYKKYISALEVAKNELPIKDDDREKVNNSINKVIKDIVDLMKDDTLNIFKKEFENIKSIREQLVY